jgi:hypothetical protein
MPNSWRCASPNCNRLRKRVPFLCLESANYGTQVSGRRRNPSSVGQSYGSAAFTPVGYPSQTRSRLVDLGRVCCAK